MSLNRDEAGGSEGVVQLIRNSADSAKHAYLVKFDDNIQTSNATTPIALPTPPLIASASALRLLSRAAATFAVAET